MTIAVHLFAHPILGGFTHFENSEGDTLLSFVNKFCISIVLTVVMGVTGVVTNSFLFSTRLPKSHGFGVILSFQGQVSGF